MPVNVPQNRFCTLTKSHDLKVLYKTIICFQSGTLSTNTKGVLGLLLTPCRLRFCCKAILQTSQGVWNGLVHDCSTLLIYLDENSRKTKHFQTIFTLSKVSSLNFRAKNAGDSFFYFWRQNSNNFARNNVKRDFFCRFSNTVFFIVLNIFAR